MSAEREYDIIVIGAGPAGENLAQYATESSGLTAALVERELVGGECSYYACIPSKALLRPVDVVETATHLPGVQGAVLDRDRLLARRDDWVSYYRDDSQMQWADSVDVDVIRGTGRLAGEREVSVCRDDAVTTLHARRAVVLATGSEPVVPTQFADTCAWGSRDATGVREVPRRLAIVGGGVVAAEAATWLAALGSQVTMLVRSNGLLPKVEPFAAGLVRDALRDNGVEIRFGTQVTQCRRPDATDTGLGRIHGGPVTLVTDADEAEADEILLAVGRGPRLDDIGLETIGVQPNQLIKHPESLPGWLFAIGDASGQAPLTHWGKYWARVLGEQIAAAASAKDDADGDADRDIDVAPASVALAPPPPVPQVVFSRPQVASVGLTEEQARQGNPHVVTVEVPFSAVAGAALLRDNATGAAKLVVDRVNGFLLGATFVGPEVAELVHAATVAIVGHVPVHILRHAVPSYPTASELWLRLLEALPPELRRPPN